MSRFICAYLDITRLYVNPGPVFFVLGMEGKVLSIYGHAVVRGFGQGEG